MGAGGGRGAISFSLVFLSESGLEFNSEMVMGVWPEV